VLGFFECCVLGKIFVYMRGKLVRDYEKLHIVELCHFHSSPPIIRKIKTRMMRMVGHAANTEQREIYSGIL
jgi:hypothetical protein